MNTTLNTPWVEEKISGEVKNTYNCIIKTKQNIKICGTTKAMLTSKLTTLNFNTRKEEIVTSRYRKVRAK